MLKYILFLNLVLEVALVASAQPSIQWQKSFGGTKTEEARVVQQTSDGGYIIAGHSTSNDGDLPKNQGSLDFWVLKLDANGTIQWNETYGGSQDERPIGMQQTIDGGYILVGYTRSNDGDISGYNGFFDAWILKLNNIGVIQWQKALGGSGWEIAWDVQQTSDNGFIVVGQSGDVGGDVTENQGGADFWIIKLNSSGDIEWQRSHGGNYDDIPYSVKQTPDGGYIVAGESSSTNGDVTGNHGSADYWVIKLNFDGKIEWEKSLGGTTHDRANGLVITRDGDYVVFGQSYSNNGDVSGNHGSYDFWVVKLNSTGTIEWQKALGGTQEEFGLSIQLTNDDGYILVGQTQSDNGDALGNDGGADFWVVKLSEAGELLWQKTLGGTKAEFGHSIQQTTDGGYITAGYSWSNDGDVSENKGKTDFWVVKLAPLSSATTEIQAHTLQCYPNPSSKNLYLQIPELAHSETPLQLQVSISNLLGQQISSQILTQNDLSPAVIDIETLPNGLYLVSATLPSGKVYARKICKE